MNLYTTEGDTFNFETNAWVTEYLCILQNLFFFKNRVNKNTQVFILIFVCFNLFEVSTQYMQNEVMLFGTAMYERCGKQFE